MTKSRLRILIHSTGTDTDLLIDKAISTYLPDCERVTTDDANIFPFLAEHTFHIVLLTNLEPNASKFKAQMLKILSYHPNLTLVPVVPADNISSIQTIIELDISFYLTLPIDPEEVSFVLRRIFTKLEHHPTYNSQKHSLTRKIPGFIGAGPAMSKLFELIHRVARDDYATVLIRGESGTGKELVAKAIHSQSSRSAYNFVPVNCAAIPDDLLESELFGHLKGSFTGANQNKTGRIQYADKGTLFLDEIGDMKPALQAKLLRVLQEKEFEPVGSLKAIPVDTRIVAATHCDLEELVQNGDFREDLYYRLSVIPIEVPPLRERTEDIPLLLERFVAAFTIERDREKIIFTPETVSILMRHEWRGNVRELENLVQHMSILNSGRKIRPQDLPEKFLGKELAATLSQLKTPLNAVSDNSIQIDFLAEKAELYTPFSSNDRALNLENGPVDFNELINNFETDLILMAMRQTDGNKKEAARLLCLKRTTLLEKIKKKGLEGQWL